MGWTETSHEIWIRGFYHDLDEKFNIDFRMSVHFVIHELGHAFDRRTDWQGRDMLSDWIEDRRVPDRPVDDYVSGLTYGFAGPFSGEFNGVREKWLWQQSRDPATGEEFADMFLGWTFDTWEGDRLGERTEAGQQRANYMDFLMEWFCYDVLEICY